MGGIEIVDQNVMCGVGAAADDDLLCGIAIHISNVHVDASIGIRTGTKQLEADVPSACRKNDGIRRKFRRPGSQEQSDLTLLPQDQTVIEAAPTIAIMTEAKITDLHLIIMIPCGKVSMKNRVRYSITSATDISQTP